METAVRRFRFCWEPMAAFSMATAGLLPTDGDKGRGGGGATQVSGVVPEPPGVLGGDTSWISRRHHTHLDPPLSSENNACDILSASVAVLVRLETQTPLQVCGKGAGPGYLAAHSLTDDCEFCFSNLEAQFRV